MVVVVPAGGQLIGVVGVLEAMQAANQVCAAAGRPAPYAVEVVTAPGGRVRTAAGLHVHTRAAADVEDVHTLVVGGALACLEQPFAPRLLDAVASLHGRAERTVGICAGAFVLADLGLLAGRRCTTHWLVTDALGRRAPDAKVAADALYVEDDGVWTSAGATAGIDLALQLLRTDLGSRVALAVARALVVYAHRPGGQSQFASAVRLRRGSEGRLEDLVTAIVQDPAGDHRVDRLAARVGMSPRNFARVFRRQTGQTPAAFVAAVRVEAAEQALVHTDTGLEQIAADCGWTSADTFRRVFRRHRGMGPADYRRYHGGREEPG